MRWLFSWLILAGSILVAAWATGLLGLGFEAKPGLSLLLGTALLAILNATLGKVLKLLTLPLSCLTLGLFSLVVNAIVLLLAGEAELGFSFTDKGGAKFMAAFVASLIIGATNGILSGIFLKDKDKDERRD